MLLYDFRYQWLKDLHKRNCKQCCWLYSALSVFKMNILKSSKYIILQILWAHFFISITLSCIVSNDVDGLPASKKNNGKDVVSVQVGSEHICNDDNCKEQITTENNDESITLLNQYIESKNSSANSTNIEDDEFDEESEHGVVELTTDVTGIVTSTEKLVSQTESKRPFRPTSKPKSNARRYYTFTNSETGGRDTLIIIKTIKIKL